MNRLRVTLASVALGSAAIGAGAAGAQEQQRPDPAWLRADSATKTAEFTLIAGLTTFYGGLTFNGFREGGLTLTVPVGWRVVLHFENRDPNLPHSVEVVWDGRPVPTGPVAPALRGAAGTKLAEGHARGDTEDVRFVAGRAGSYLIFCAVPGHGAAGMWIRLEVSASVQVPTLK